MKRRSPVLDMAQSWWLLAVTAVALLPLAPHLPAWLTLAAAAALGLRAWLVASRRRAPPRWMLVLAAVAGAVGVTLHYRMFLGQNAGVALLVLLLALKQLESRTRRDGLTIVLLCYFLAQASLFYSQALPAAAGLLVVVVVATATFCSLTDSRPPAARLLRRGLLMLAHAAPFLLILFVLFPRVSGPLWGLPRDAHSALGGLSDTMAPGSIGRISQSDAIAFRVGFTGPPPPRKDLYWRGPVLTLFDGTTWRAARSGISAGLPYVPDHRQAVEYEVTLEPDNRPWLFALELPSSLPPDSLIAGDYQLLARTAVTERRRYALASRPGQQAGADEAWRVLALARTLPAQRNPRTVALGRTWAASGAGDAAIVETALAFFIRQRLAYTLEPPLLGENGVDEFLFETRQGFCEHFAGAFVVAMRAAGVPARVVTGYQGGEINPIDGYLTVRQSDAHAWAEVWLQGRGWTRIDPTAASFPDRIDFNIAAAVRAGDPVPLMLRADWLWLHDARLRWEAATGRWNQWILGYTPQRQRDFLAGFGIPDWRRMTMVLAVSCAAVVFGLFLWARRQRRRTDAAQVLWLRAEARLARRGMPRQPWEGPEHYAERIAAARPDFAAAILDIARLYADIRYGSIGAIESLRRRVAAFRP